MAECTFCGDELEKSAGKMFVRADGSRLYFCSGKCQKNWGNDRKLGYAEH